MASKLLPFEALRRDHGIDLSRDQIRRMSRTGKFPAPRRYPGGHRIYFVESEIIAWIESLPPAIEKKAKG
jgi:predicted DNA-binding transcriptional regulator AlpA